MHRLFTTIALAFAFACASLQAQTPNPALRKSNDSASNLSSSGLTVTGAFNAGSASSAALPAAGNITINGTTAGNLLTLSTGTSSGNIPALGSSGNLLLSSGAGIMVGSNLMTFPGSTATLAGLGIAQTWTATQTFPSPVITGSTATINGVTATWPTAAGQILGSGMQTLSATEQAQLDLNLHPNFPGIYLAAESHPGNDYLSMMISTDGLNWIDLPPYSKPIGDAKIYNPSSSTDFSIARYNGAFYFCNTDETFGNRFSNPYSNYFHVSKSTDLVNWSALQNVQVYPSAGAHVSWAPCFVKNSDGTLYVDGSGYAYITLTQAVSSVDGRCGLYKSLASSMNSWSFVQDISPLTSPDSGLDWVCFADNGNFYLLYLAGRSGHQYLELWKASTLTGTYSLVRTGDWLNLGQTGTSNIYESPSIIRIGSRWEIRCQSQSSYTGAGVSKFISCTGNIETATMSSAVSLITPDGNFQGDLVFVSDPAEWAAIQQKMSAVALNLTNGTLNVNGRTLQLPVDQPGPNAVHGLFKYFLIRNVRLDQAVSTQDTIFLGACALNTQPFMPLGGAVYISGNTGGSTGTWQGTFVYGADSWFLQTPSISTFSVGSVYSSTLDNNWNPIRRLAGTNGGDIWLISNPSGTWTAQVTATVVVWGIEL